MEMATRGEGLLSPQEFPTVDFIIKLGGAAVTKKSQLETLNPESIQIIAEQFQRLFQREGRPPRFIVCHGAGSFGHHYAKQYSVHLGTSTGDSEERLAELKRGISLIRAQLATLSANITGIFTAVGLNAVCVPAFPSWVTHSAPQKPQSIYQADLSGISQIISQGFIPIIHGDCVFDDVQTFAILSGDLIVAHLATVFKPKAVIFASDVDGVFSSPPFTENGERNLGAQLIPEIHVDSNGSYSIPKTSNLNHDVTGGMLGKLECGKEIAMGGVPVFLTRAGSDAMFQICSATLATKLCKPPNWIGTEMHLKNTK